MPWFLPFQGELKGSSRTIDSNREGLEGCFTGNVTINLAPCAGTLAAVMLPRCRSTILQQIAKPMPVPSYSLRLCNR